MKKKLLFTIAAAFTVFSCDEFLDINTNPNQTTISTPELVLANAMTATAAQTFYNQMGAMFAGQWSPSGDVSGFVQEKTYDFSNTYGTAIWNNFYDILNDYQYVQEEGAATGKNGAAAVAKIMSAFLYHKLVDVYNNVPYTDALQGTEVIRPSYDNGQAVYDAIVDDLDEAVAALSAISDPGDNPGAADIVYGGDYAEWIKFANTLKLRLLIRQSEIGRDAYISAEIGETSGSFLTADAGANPGYLKTSGKQNPFWDTYYLSENDALRNTYNFIRSTEFLEELTNGDPRQSLIIGPSGKRPYQDDGTAETGPINGVEYGDESPSAYSNASSGLGRGVLKAYNQDVILISAAESYFLQAEAIVRGYMAGDAAAAYNNGVQASFNTVGAGDATSFLTEDEPFDGTIEQIITQKYIALAGVAAGFEAYADYRRTGLPDVPLSTKAIKSNIPVRLYYPVQELQTNSENVAAQGTIDAISTRVFWDAN
jgi:hypothetical protein